MFETSLDILYIVLALCILWFTIFLCWLLYQAARFLKNANDIVENVSNKLEIIVEAVEFIRGKVDTMTSSMGVVSKVVSGLVEKFIVGKLSKDFEDMVEEEPKPKKKRTRKKK